MADYVLVAGAWLGSWAWADVVSPLRAAGHGTHPLTLSGLADKRGVPAGQQTHVQDIVDEIERRDLRDVVLVGHSYSGIPVGQAAERIGDRLTRVVFVDSEVPVDGESFASGWWQGQAAFEALITDDGYWPPLGAAEFDGQGLTEEQVTRLVEGSTGHPAATLTEPAVLTGALGDLPATYIKCLLDGPEPNDTVAKLLTSDRWRLVTMATGHWPMFSQPTELARLLLAEAA
ncbi:pimeloyl-ACP methyl ester carboxylesterase [Micromonospora luteifusca]|uniref:Pimeloyl-ACP methyl ester carboxylesterase n=1 Tax=Micromonospora luteifusca TaxID=709860 RepID=A0ABS2M2I4_9ACTN|nr:alpha/beta hydrolase [Micromonospora luteifusca]MBM7494641.1 pimeloyl-ACP methyl ester carboxylesterase [Micromonospora luteifusca]